MGHVRTLNAKRKNAVPALVDTRDCLRFRLRICGFTAQRGDLTARSQRVHLGPDLLT
jgi:hypothetical protein